MYYVTKTYGPELGLSACFRQWRATSHCRLLHGYALSFTLKFGAFELNENEWVIDFGGLKDVKAFLVDTFDHRLVVANDDPSCAFLTELGHDVPRHAVDNACQSHTRLANILLLPKVGCEAFASYVYDWVEDWLGNGPDADRVFLHSVEVREHGGNSAIYQNANA